MKHFSILFLFALTAAVLAAEDPKPADAAKPAGAKPPVSVLTSIYRTNPKATDFADPEKAGHLLKLRDEKIREIQNERERILKEDPKAKALNEDIMRQLRQLASLLESKKTMIDLDSELQQIDSAISNLKPASAPESGEKPKAGDNAGKADKE